MSTQIDFEKSFTKVRSLDLDAQRRIQTASQMDTAHQIEGGGTVTSEMEPETQEACARIQGELRAQKARVLDDELNRIVAEHTRLFAVAKADALKFGESMRELAAFEQRANRLIAACGGTLRPAVADVDFAHRADQFAARESRIAPKAQAERRGPLARLDFSSLFGR